ncbi:hypothetical protein PS6_008349 [Mucor atramentarius]
MNHSESMHMDEAGEQKEQDSQQEQHQNHHHLHLHQSTFETPEFMSDWTDKQKSGNLL